MLLQMRAPACSVTRESTEELRVHHRRLVHRRPQLFQDVTVGVQHIGGFSRINPPARVNMRKDGVTLVDQPLNGVRDFILSAR